MNNLTTIKTCLSVLVFCIILNSSYIFSSVNTSNTNIESNIAIQAIDTINIANMSSIILTSILSIEVNSIQHEILSLIIWLIYAVVIAKALITVREYKWF